MTADTHRVYKITDADRKQLVAKRTEQGATNELLIQSAVEAKLDSLVESLNDLGFASEGESKRPIRLPLSDQTIAALREASENTGLPQAVLMTLVLRSHCGQAAAPKAAPKTKRKPAARKTAPKATGATRKAPKTAKPAGAAPKTRARKTTQKAAPKRTSKKGAK